MNFVLVPHLPRLVAMVAKLVLYERKISNFIYYFLVVLFIFISLLTTMVDKILSDTLQPNGCKLSY